MFALFFKASWLPFPFLQSLPLGSCFALGVSSRPIERVTVFVLAQKRRNAEKTNGGALAPWMAAVFEGPGLAGEQRELEVEVGGGGGNQSLQIFSSEGLRCVSAIPPRLQRLM